jgi:hypothetical protein
LLIIVAVGLIIGWSMSSGHGHIHRLPNRGACIAQQPIQSTFRAPKLSIRALASRVSVLKNLKTSVCLYFHCWLEYKQRLIIQFLLKANANADNILRTLQAQFTDGPYSIRSVRCWY